MFNLKNMNDMPEEMLVKIFHYLDRKTVPKALQVCKKWQSMIDNPDNLEKQLKEKKEQIKKYSEKPKWDGNLGLRALTFSDNTAWSHGHRAYGVISLILILATFVEMYLYFRSDNVTHGLAMAFLLTSLYCISEPTNAIRITDFFAHKQQQKIDNKVNDLNQEIRDLEIRIKKFN